MEALAARFDALQEDLMAIYETGPQTLETQIKHWQLIRHEQAMYYVARRQGINRLGMYPVPPSSVSEQRAKQAIEMHLHLSSLSRSPYAHERWTLPETSYETFMASPQKTFKKKGVQVTVVYDNNNANAMVYTVYKDLYVQDDNDMWHKLHSDVDYYGVYYTDLEGQRIYYQTFADDAEQYSESGQWKVLFENKTFSAPVTSSVSSGRTSGGPRGSKEGEDSEASSSSTPATRSRKSPRPASRRLIRGDRRRSRSRSRSSRSRSSSSSRSHRNRGEPQHSPRFVRGGGRGRRGDSTGADTDSEEESGGHSPGTARPLGRGAGETSSPAHRRRTPRIVQLLKDANDPPVLLLQGPANTLKGFRRKSRMRYASLYMCMSTAFSWVSGTCTKRLGPNQRMLVAFCDESQRTKFLSVVQLPRSVSFVKGFLDGL